MKLQGLRMGSWGELAGRMASSRCTHAPTPFQAGNWLAAWYATMPSQGDVEPVVLATVETASGRILAGWPLVRRRRQGGLRTIEFADGDITDYNAPLLAGDIEHVPPAAELIQSIVGALPPADILCLTKMPSTFGRFPNMLKSADAARPSELNANVLNIGDDWDAYRRKVLAKKFRKELERSWRVFERSGEDARFEQIADPDLADWVLSCMEPMQEMRIRDLGLDFHLNDEPYQSFYRELVRTGIGDGSVVVTALRSGRDRLVAGLIGIRSCDTYAMVRMAQDSRNWSKCSPGKLVIDRTLHLLHEQGIRSFDFTTGDYDYKYGFGVEQQPLIEFKKALSLKGNMKLQSGTVVEEVKSTLRRYPKLYGTMKALMRGNGGTH